MSRITLFFAFLLFAGSSEARQLSMPSRTWDVSVTAGSFHGESPDTTPSGNPADWHHASEWRVTAGHYFSPHLKTEIEFGATGEGNRYTQRFLTVPGSTTTYPYSAQDFVRVRQGSAKLTWQFLDNQWIHPYLSAGVSFDEERTRTHVYSPVFYPDPRNPSTRIAGVAEHDEAPRTTYRPGLVLGGGAKWYVSPTVFIKTGAQFGVAPATKAARTVSFVAGMGFDF
jgi:opacity protein-like surface antigen